MLKSRIFFQMGLDKPAAARVAVSADLPVRHVAQTPTMRPALAGVLSEYRLEILLVTRSPAMSAYRSYLARPTNSDTAVRTDMMINPGPCVAGAGVDFIRFD
jgi:hypothetical protein